MLPRPTDADMFMWIADWAWSLPLILLTVVIHVFGLGVINEKVVRTLSRSTDRRGLVPRFAIVMGAAVLLMTALHGRDAAPVSQERRPRMGGVFAIKAVLRLRPAVQSTECSSSPLSRCNVRHGLAYGGSLDAAYRGARDVR